MGGCFSATVAFDVLADRFGIEVVDADTKDLLGRYNVAPSQLVPVVFAPDGPSSRWSPYYQAKAGGRSILSTPTSPDDPSNLNLTFLSSRAWGKVRAVSSRSRAHSRAQAPWPTLRLVGDRP